MRLAVVLLVAGVLLCAGIVYRCIQIIEYPSGGGRHVESPDGLYEASASTLSDEDFWGRRSSWYEFEVTDKRSGMVVASKTLPITTGVPRVSYRYRGTIDWAPDSSSVSFGTGSTILWSTTVP